MRPSLGPQVADDQRQPVQQLVEPAAGDGPRQFVVTAADESEAGDVERPVGIDPGERLFLEIRTAARSLASHGELHERGPADRLHQLRDVDPSQTGDLAQLVVGEQQVRLIDLDEIAGGRQPRQVECRPPTRPHEHVAISREPVDQVAEHGRVGQAVRIVDDEADLPWRHRHDGLRDTIDVGHVVGSTERQQRPGQEALGVVGLDRREPDVDPIGLIGEALRQQRGLADPAAPHDERQRHLEPLLQRVPQPRPGDGLGRRSRRLIESHHPGTAPHRVPRSRRTPHQGVLQAQQLSAAASTSGRMLGSEISTAVVRPTPITSGSGFSIEAKNVPVVSAGIKVR